MKKITLLLCMSFFLPGCNLKDVGEDIDDLFKMNKDRLTHNAWVLYAYTQTPAYNGVSDVYAIMAPCAKDNLYWFMDDNTYAWGSGSLKCSESESTLSEVGTWEIPNSNEWELIITTEDGTTHYEIEILSEDNLIISTTVTEESVTYKITQSFMPE